MGGAEPERYLDQLPSAQRELLRAVNRVGLDHLTKLLANGSAVAFLGAGTSVPLYPLWDEVISCLIDAAADHLDEQSAATCRALARDKPDAVVEIVRHRLGAPLYREVLREVFRPRRDAATGRTWTPTQELVARCNFAGVLTTNYDPGIVNARMAVRPAVAATGFASWSDDNALDGWRRGDALGDGELPVLFAHGHHNQPDTIVLATTEYRKAYAGKLARMLGTIVDTGQLVWIGFSFADRRIDAILREVAEGTGPRLEPGGVPRHVALMPWDPVQSATDVAPHAPDVLRSLIEIQVGAHVVLYPAPAGDHSALERLLEEFADPRYPAPAVSSAAPAPRDAAEVEADGPPVHWVHGGDTIDHFTGRVEELTHLSRWARDDSVRLVGVTAWGGTGKTALVTRWVEGEHGATQRPALRGAFVWSFYEDPSAERWAVALLAWAQEQFGVAIDAGALAGRVLKLARKLPLLFVLDGLEVMQESPSGARFGRLLDGMLRTTLTGLCTLDHHGLVLLTSRFPFADLDQFDGGTARMLELPSMTPDEGAELLASAGGGWLSAGDRRDLAAAVDGHALAIGALAGVLSDQPGAGDLDALRRQLAEAHRTDARVARVLAFYRDRLSREDQQLAGIVALFQRPIEVANVLQLGANEKLGAPLKGWTRHQVETAVRQRLTGLLSWHSGGTISAHPLIRDAFRPLVLTGAAAHQVLDVALAKLPEGAVESREDALRVVEMVELLIDADEWHAADDLYAARSARGSVWRHLPAAHLGQRCTSAFVGTDERRAACRERLGLMPLGYYLNGAGLAATNAGDIVAAERFLGAAVELFREHDEEHINLPIGLSNLFGCFRALGKAEEAQAIASEAITSSGDNVRNATVANVAMGTALHLAGETQAADRLFILADVIECAGEGHGQRHMYSSRATDWAAFLLQTERLDVCRRLTEHNIEISSRNGWNEDVARCNHMLGLCDLAEGDLASASERLAVAAAIFHDGDFLMEWGTVLGSQASHRRLAGDLDAAERLCSETVTLAGPRELVPLHASALAVRAQVHCDRFAADRDERHLERAGDDADHVLRLATRTRRLPWAELAGIEAWVRVNELAERDGECAQKAAALRAVLLPPELDPDPLGTVEQAAAELLREQDAD
ncbi:MAG: SIR2 family protein [Conexibacter sp.]